MVRRRRSGQGHLKLRQAIRERAEALRQVKVIDEQLLDQRLPKPQADALREEKATTEKQIRDLEGRL